MAAKLEHVAAVFGDVERPVAHTSHPVDPEDLPQLLTVQIDVQQQRGQELLAVGPIAGGSSSSDEIIETLIERDRPTDTGLLVLGVAQARVTGDGVSLVCHVGACFYIRHMSVRGLSNLVVTIMAAGEVHALPARDQRRLHEALLRLNDDERPEARALLGRLGDPLSWRAHPSVGMRASGVTEAVWDAVAAGHLRATECGTDAWFELTDAGRQLGGRHLMALPAEQAQAVYETGAAWAAASTLRKKAASAIASSASTRRVKLA